MKYWYKNIRNYEFWFVAVNNSRSQHVGGCWIKIGIKLCIEWNLNRLISIKQPMICWPCECVKLSQQIQIQGITYLPRSLSGRFIYRSRISSMLQSIYEKVRISSFVYIFNHFVKKKNNRELSSKPSIAREESGSPRWRKHDETDINIT